MTARTSSISFANLAQPHGDCEAPQQNPLAI
jgi:hypothetical protein